jgi:hypothetical protein
VLREKYSWDSQIKGDEMDFACDTQEGEKKFLLGLVIIMFFQTLLCFTSCNATVKMAKCCSHIGHNLAISFTKI